MSSLHIVSTSAYNSILLKCDTNWEDTSLMKRMEGSVPTRVYWLFLSNPTGSFFKSGEGLVYFDALSPVPDKISQPIHEVTVYYYLFSISIFSIFYFFSIIFYFNCKFVMGYFIKRFFKIKSMYEISSDIFLSSAASQSYVHFRRLVTVDLFDRKPCWKVELIFFSFRYLRSFS